MVVNRIQSELAQRREIRVGNYVAYAELVENLFMPAALAALEEYGLPMQIARKLKDRLEPHYDLDDVIARLRGFDARMLEELEPFEQSLVEAVQYDL